MIFDKLEAGTLYNIYLIATDELNEKSVVMADSEVLTYRITTKDDDSKFIIKNNFFFKLNSYLDQQFKSVIIQALFVQVFFSYCEFLKFR